MKNLTKIKEKRVRDDRKSNNKAGRKAFTLAEVLITLVIIGVIGALTVPALIQNTQKQEYVSALKKAYSTLSQAAQMIAAEEGAPKCDDGGWACSAQEAHNMIKKYINNVKECEKKEGCYNPKYFTQLSGRKEGIDRDSDWEYYNLIFADGMVFGIASGWVSKNCSGSSGNFDRGVCVNSYIDVNGEKGPNTIGRDVFGFFIKEDGALYPTGCGHISSCNQNANGWECACRVLTEGAMNY